MTPRFWSLVLKELRQIRRDKRLVLSLIIPPVVELERAISAGRLDLGVVVPHEFARQLGRGQAADVQVLINGVKRQYRSARPGPCSGRGRVA
jgi:hypothetical protein